MPKFDMVFGMILSSKGHISGRGCIYSISVVLILISMRHSV